jgi:hypothetical protein
VRIFKDFLVTLLIEGPLPFAPKLQKIPFVCSLVSKITFLNIETCFRRNAYNHISDRIRSHDPSEDETARPRRHARASGYLVNKIVTAMARDIVSTYVHDLINVLIHFW